MAHQLITCLDADQRRALENVREAAGRIWARPLHRTFTDHTPEHSGRIITLLDGLTAGMMATDKRLAPTEVWVLLAAAYLHDIGMQNERFAGGDLDEIRDQHHEQTAEMIYAVFEAPASAFAIPLARDPAMVEAVALVAKGHRRVDLAAAEYDPLVHGSETLRPRLLAALLRFGDELDIDYRRVDMEQMKLLALPTESLLHWWKCHYVGGVSIVDEYIRIAYRFPRDRPDYEGLIVPLVEEGIRAGHAALEEIFRADAVKVALGKSQVRLMRLVQPLPPEVEALARERAGGAGPVRLPVSEPQEDAGQPDLKAPRISFKGKEYIYIPPGPFLMGTSPRSGGGSDDEDDLEAPQHPVTLAGYYIARYPVTNAEYQVFVQATGHRVPYRDDELSAPFNWSPATRTYPEGQADYPVVLVSWHDARAYCAWLGGRLPSEAEWEKAARGDDGRRWPWGDRWSEGRCNSAESGLPGPTPVGHFSPRGDSPYGVGDMAGNVWEWCSSLRDPYPYRADDSREATEAMGKRVLRGGAWGLGRRYARCAFRGGTEPDDYGFTIGFRVVLAGRPAEGEGQGR